MHGKCATHELYYMGYILGNKVVKFIVIRRFYLRDGGWDKFGVP